MDFITNWWESLSAVQGVFAAIGLVSNVLFVAYLIFSLTGNDDADAPDDIDSDLFPVLSLRSVLAFGMFMGWTALSVSKAGISWFWAVAAGLAAGWLAAWLAWRLVQLMLRWQSSGTLIPEASIGRTGTIHLIVPAHEQGTGKLMLEVQGALREFDVLTSGEAIPTGALARVVQLLPDGNLLVEPA